MELQIGSEVSTADIASHLSISKAIVEKYLNAVLERMKVYGLNRRKSWRIKGL